MKTHILLLVIASFLNTTLPMAAQDLSSHEWKDRLLLVLTTENSEDLYKEQMELFKDDIDGLEERKLVVYSVMPEQYKKGIQCEKWIESTSLNDQYRKGDKGFEIILLGLDGRVKLRQSEVLSIEKLFRTIDAMPMRRNKMRNKEKSGIEHR
ncbi:DUF4174 domain-containing protein [Marinilabilia rubra]|nr:DUF4174 domain-containing protein [Marinilabilia rubra]